MMNKELARLYTPLQSLNNIRYSYFHNNGGLEIEYIWFDKIEKSLKALNIIKEKLCYIDFRLLIFSTDYETYCFMVGNKKLTEEEYYLLREVLK